MMPTLFMILLAVMSFAVVTVWLFRSIIRHVEPVLVACGDPDKGL